MTSDLPATILHIPHARTFIPPTERLQFVLSDADLSRELIRMPDRYTDELFDLPEGVARKVVFGYSRFLVDPERFRDNADETMSSRGMGAAYTKTSHGEALRRPVINADRERLLDTYYDTYRATMTNAVEAALREHGRCFIVNGHSFSSQPLPCDLDQRHDRPYICIGADEFHTPVNLVDAAAALFRSAGWSVDITGPLCRLSTMVAISVWLQS